jgi:hypothetical protein
MTKSLSGGNTGHVVSALITPRALKRACRFYSLSGDLVEYPLPSLRRGPGFIAGRIGRPFSQIREVPSQFAVATQADRHIKTASRCPFSISNPEGRVFFTKRTSCA